MGRRLSILCLISVGGILALIWAWAHRAPTQAEKGGPARTDAPVTTLYADPVPGHDERSGAARPEVTQSPPTPEVPSAAALSGADRPGESGTESRQLDVADTARQSGSPLARGASRRRVPMSSERRAPRKQVVKSVASAMDAARTRPVDALRALSRLQPSPERDAGLSHALSQWADVEPAQALLWVNELPRGELREKLGAAAATAISEHDPVGAADFVATEMRDGVARNNAVMAVIQRWAQRDPGGAREWAERFPESSIRTDALREIAVQERASGSNR